MSTGTDPELFSEIGVVTADTHASLLLESRFENIEVAERVLVDMLTEADCGGEDEYWMITALREAIANAVRHGAAGDPGSRVEIGLRLEGLQLTVTVADSGQGFDPDTIPDPTDPQNLLQTSGRGIFYMRRFMDSVEIDSQPGRGTLVTMSRILTAGRDKGETQ